MKTNTIIKTFAISLTLIILFAVLITGCLPGSEKKSPSSTASHIAAQPPSPSLTSAYVAQSPVVTATAQPEPSSGGKVKQVIYKNTQFGFMFVLPQDWNGYTIVNDKWKGNNVKSGKTTETGPMISIRNPKWTTKTRYQDIPILIFTMDQWKALQNDTFHIGAAPIGPSELGRNSTYVFALPARYNYAFPEGWKEVESYLAGKPIQTFDPSK